MMTSSHPSYGSSVCVFRAREQQTFKLLMHICISTLLTHTPTHTYIYIYLFICISILCICIYLYVNIFGRIYCWSPYHQCSKVRRTQWGSSHMSIHCTAPYTSLRCYSASRSCCSSPGSLDSPPEFPLPSPPGRESRRLSSVRACTLGIPSDPWRHLSTKSYILIYNFIANPAVVTLAQDAGLTNIQLAVELMFGVSLQRCSSDLSVLFIQL